MEKILFIHNTVMPYRFPFFKYISSLYSIHFLFTDLELVRYKYNTALPPVEEMNKLKYIGLKNKYDLRYVHQLLGNYDIIVDSFFSKKAFLSFIIAKIRGKPIIFWSEAWGWKKDESIYNKLVLLIESFVIVHSDGFLVPGSIHKEYFIHKGAFSEKIFIMPNVCNIPLNIDESQRDEIKRDLRLVNKKVILYVGRLKIRKGVHYLLQAFERLSNDFDNIILMIIGTGNCKDKLIGLAKALNIEDKVYFMGYVDDKFLPIYYSLSDICVVPSITYGFADPCPLTVNESMHFGKPVIATDAVGSAFDMIENGKNGYIVPECNTQALYASLKNILTDPKLEARMGLESRKISEKNFNYDKMIEAFQQAVSMSVEKSKI